jgi:hypothetical protein
MRSILLILVGKRKQAAVQVQKVLTGWGCMIKTRVGIHESILENCSDKGLIILELVGDREKMEELARKVSLIKDVASQLVDLELIAEKKVLAKPKTKKKTK